MQEAKLAGILTDSGSDASQEVGRALLVLSCALMPSQHAGSDVQPQCLRERAAMSGHRFLWFCISW